MDVFSKFIESFLLALAPVIASLVAAYVGLKLKELWAQMQEANPDAYYWLTEVAEMAVQAAESAGLAGLIEDKKKYALEIAEKYLKEQYNITIDLDLIAAAIEAAVLKNQEKFARVAELKLVE